MRTTSQVATVPTLYKTLRPRNVQETRESDVPNVSNTPDIGFDASNAGKQNTPSNSLQENDSVETATAEQPATSKYRILLIVSILVGLYFLGKQTGWVDQFNPESIRESVQGAGVWGFAIYLAVFSLGEFIHVPGIVFVGGGILAYGKLLGFFAAFLGANVSVCFSFLVVRKIGGQVARDSRFGFVRRAMKQLDTRPIATVAVLRMVLFISPAINYALALSGVRFRDYLIGSALGLSGPLLAITLFFDKLID